ncbi:patatin-like phospholipase family protein [Parvularcula marina]|uniref:patatin-like phospholipase family protein n=1 Tax=Parvularcula marina TaxID=2292771 RepID=UPI003517180B
MLSRFANSAGELGLSFKPRRRNYRRPDMHDHLEPTGHKRLLALDGGGVRSAMSIAILEKIEGTLQRRHGNHDSFKLSDYFDLIGGTSTGSILAAALATNAVRASELRTLYEDLTRDVFRRGGQFDEKRLGQALERIFGSKTLGGEMATGLAVVARRVDTDSTLVFHNNPEGPNYDDAPEKAALGYARYPVANVIRASTAYPGEFAPAQVKLARLPHLEEGLFVDAGFTPFNNPAFQLFLLATLDNRGFGWTKGEEQLLVTSVGTGSLCNELSPGSNRRSSRAKQAQRGLNFMIDGAEHTGELLMQLLSEPAVPQETIQEFGDLRDARLTPEPQCTYQRYQAKLTAKTLSDEFGLGLSTRQLNRVRNMMDRDGFQIAYEIGQAVADTLVREDHFPAAFNLEPLTAARAIKPADKAPAKEPEAEAEEAPAERAKDMTASRLAKLAESPALRRSPLPTGLPRR